MCTINRGNDDFSLTVNNSWGAYINYAFPCYKVDIAVADIRQYTARRLQFNFSWSNSIIVYLNLFNTGAYIISRSNDANLIVSVWQQIFNGTVDKITHCRICRSRVKRNRTGSLIKRVNFNILPRSKNFHCLVNICFSYQCRVAKRSFAHRYGTRWSYFRTEYSCRSSIIVLKGECCRSR